LISYSDPPITEFTYSGVRVRVLHEYRNNIAVPGNKWWKLKNNIDQARREGCDTLLTFGGAYSNHIYATAAAAKEEGFKSVGIIRGEEVDNGVLGFARRMGMELRFVSREEYRKVREDGDGRLRDGTHQRRAPNVFVIPEGGTNKYAVEGCAEWGRKLLGIEFDQVYLAVGTGGTMSGLLVGLNGNREIIGVPVLKNDGFLEDSINELTGSNYSNWRLLNEYHHGGYAKASKELIAFCKEFKHATIEPVYTGKLFWAVVDQIEKGNIKTNTTMLVIHTGGIQLINS